MKFKIITVPVLDTAMAEAELNQFLSSHQVISCEKQFVQLGQGAYWSFVLSYQEGSVAAPPSRTSFDKKSGIDYKEVLSDDDFNRYAELRELRKNIAQQENKPAYAVFTNEQLAALVTQRVTTKTAMAEVEGIGSARMENYAEQFLPLLQRLNQ